MYVQYIDAVAICFAQTLKLPQYALFYSPAEFRTYTKAWITLRRFGALCFRRHVMYGYT
jgi:hypothetical protein